MVSIIGTGNLAWHFVRIFEQEGIRIEEVFARKRKNAEDLQGYAYDVAIKTDLNFGQSRARVFILAVPDDALAAVAAEIVLPPEAILVHASGARPMNTLTAALNRNPDALFGVFYPLMTFTRGVPVDFRTVPFCIEAENEQVAKMLKKIAGKVSNHVLDISSSQRATLHVAAVFACNFVNHLWALAKEIVDDEELDFELLQPLIQATFAKAMRADHPAEVQTGPALRNDKTTLQMHQKLLAADEDLLQIYQSLTKSIQDWHQ